MNWFYASRKIHSAKNGTIRCARVLGAWEVTVDGYYQTARYITAMWQACLRRVPKSFPVKRVLLLGLGAGGTIDIIHRRFPHAHVTAVEWDPDMIALTHELKLYPTTCEPEIIQDDAAIALPKLTGTFDLIIFDLYRGEHPSALITDEPFLRSVQRLLSRDGYFLVNVFREKEALVVLDRFFARWSDVIFRLNACAVYRHIGLGHIGDPLPAGYVPYRMDEAYVQREGQAAVTIDGVAGGPGMLGRRWHHGPFQFEVYFGDQEPKPTHGTGRRLVMWQRITRQDQPTGWRRSPVMMHMRKTGFAEIGSADRYWSDWSSHAQRHRDRWLAHQPYALTEVTYASFEQAYRTSHVRKGLKQLFLQVLAQKHTAHGLLVHYLVATARDDGRVVAGFAFLDVPESRQSIHLISFVEPEAEKSSVGVGLIDAWFRYGISQGLRFLDFDAFYAPHDPRSWRGFSRFKSQFGIHFIAYPPALIRFVR